MDCNTWARGGPGHDREGGGGHVGDEVRGMRDEAGLWRDAEDSPRRELHYTDQSGRLLI